MRLYYVYRDEELIDVAYQSYDEAYSFLCICETLKASGHYKIESLVIGGAMTTEFEMWID